MKKKLNREYGRLRTGALLSFANVVHFKMTDNPNFAVPNPPLTVLAAAIQSYEEACDQWERGNKLKGLVRDQTEENLINLLDLLANYVELEGGFDENKLLTSGFELRRDNTTHPVPGIPFILNISDGLRSGSAKIKFDCEGRAASFAIGFKPQGTDAPMQYRFGITKRTYTVEGLTPGLYYIFQICAINAAGQSEWSAEQVFLVR